MRKANIVYCCVFVLMCGLCPILMVFGGSDEENLSKRSLAKFPAVETAGDILNFPQGFDDYLADNIPYRNHLITAYNSGLAALTGDMGNEQVTFGKDGWLFFNETMDDYVSINQLTDTQISQLARNLKLQSNYMEAMGSRFIVAIAPNKNSIYPEMMRSFGGSASIIRNPEGRNLWRLQQSMDNEGIEYVDLQAILTAAKGDSPLYYSGDTHWNDYGAYIAYRELLASTGLGITPFEADISWANGYKGDLADMVFPASEGSGIKAVVTGMGEYRYTRPPRSMEDLTISTTADGAHTLLMHRDSFANALIPLMSGDFAAAHYHREQPYRYSKAEDIQPDAMIWELAERNIPHLLESAPVMPAPETTAGGNAHTLPEDMYSIYIEEEHGLTHIYGYIDPQYSNGQEGIVIVIDGKGYEPFRLLEGSIAGEAIGLYGEDVKHSGFSLWADTGSEHVQVAMGQY